MPVNKLSRRLTGWTIRNGTRTLSRIARLHPNASLARYDVELIENVPYQTTRGKAAPPAFRLDVYHPRRSPLAAADGRTPVVLYMHGGGFRICSKETHWAMALSFAARGYTVFVPNYRLAPVHPYPAAVEDACAALLWTLDHAHRFGANAERLVLAGESAGANLVTALTIAACFERDEPYARRVFAADPNIRAVLPACGIFQVSDTDRLGQKGWLNDRLLDVSQGYLGGSTAPSLDLADVVTFLESRRQPVRPLPPFFQIAGDRDPLIADAERLHDAISAHGGSSGLTVYHGGFHAFHAFLFTGQARHAWDDQIAFLADVMADAAPIVAEEVA